MNELIAYCGLDCESCDARIATVNDDEALREKTAKLWSELNGVPITAEMIRCTGCRVEGVKTPYCESLCPIRRCAADKRLQSCGNCADMGGCERIGVIHKSNPAAKERIMK